MFNTQLAGRWPKTGNLEDVGVGNCINLPVPAGFKDSEMALVRDDLILARLQAFAPDAIVLQCGADGVEVDPQSRGPFGRKKMCVKVHFGPPCDVI
jgi:acetoin utilization protein AcuC